MPYGIPRSKGGESPKNEAKMQRCIVDVMAKGNSKLSAILICKKSLGFTK